MGNKKFSVGLAFTALLVLITQLQARGQNADSAQNRKRYLFVLSRLRTVGSLIKSQGTEGSISAGLQNASSLIDSSVSNISREIGTGGLSLPDLNGSPVFTSINNHQKNESAVFLLGDARKNLNAIKDSSPADDVRVRCIGYINRAIASLQNELHTSEVNANTKTN